MPAKANEDYVAALRELALATLTPVLKASIGGELRPAGVQGSKSHHLRDAVQEVFVGQKPLGSKFSQAVNQVQATIGGTAQGVDKEMIQTLQAAEKQVDAAIAALQQASQAATKFASSL